MEALFELLFEFLAEVLLGVVLEVLAEMGLRVLTEPFRRAPHPAVAAIGYLFFGAFAGGISLLLAPGMFMHDQRGRIGSLLLAPLAAGLVMTGVGAWRRKRAQELIRLDRFAYGYLFALAMALVRFTFGH